MKIPKNVYRSFLPALLFTLHVGQSLPFPHLSVPWSFFFFVSSVGRLRVCNPAIYRGPHATLILGLRNASWRNRPKGPNGRV